MGVVWPDWFRREFVGSAGAALKRRLAAVPPLVWLLLLTLALLLPFIGKAFFIDDTLFLRAAEQIQKHPLNFYGFNINWYGYTTPMTKAMDNPPLDSYYIALVASLFGWREWVLHLAFLLPALAAVWGIYELAKNYCQRPFIAALVALLTPVFLISATAVMCDVMQLAFWIWALVFFEKGLRPERRAALVASGVLAGLAFLTKYLALSLVPLLLAYGFCRKRRPGWWLVAPLIPLLFAAGYEWLTYRLYGHGLLMSAAHEATRLRAKDYYIPWEKVTIGLSFVGACFLPVLVYAPWLWPRRIFLALPCLVAGGLLVLPRMAAYTSLMWKANGNLQWGTFFFIAALVVTGVYVFLLMGMDLRERRDAASILLLLWVSGIFVFTVALNWTIDGRSLLPAVPAIGILAARRLDKKYPHRNRKFSLRILAPALVTGMISLLLVQSDAHNADSQRAVAIRLGTKYQSLGKNAWFNDHWSQYYFELHGTEALNYKHPKFSVGDILIITFDVQDFNARNFDVPGRLRLIKSGETVGKQIVSTVDPGVEAGFYSTSVGVLPFAVGDVPPQMFKVYQIVKAPGFAQAGNGAF